MNNEQYKITDDELKEVGNYRRGVVRDKLKGYGIEIYDNRPEEENTKDPVRANFYLPEHQIGLEYQFSARDVFTPFRNKESAEIRYKHGCNFAVSVDKFNKIEKYVDDYGNVKDTVFLFEDAGWAICKDPSDAEWQKNISIQRDPLEDIKKEQSFIILSNKNTNIILYL
jgi:hypothetical protein